MDKIKGINKDGKVVEINGDEWEKSQEVSPVEATSKTYKPTQKRERRFRLISYINITDLERFLLQQPWIQHWAYCIHDKDLNEDGSLKERHTHVLLYTYEAKTSSAIKKNFDRYSNEVYKGTDTEPQNTLVQIMTDTWHWWRYLIHQDNPEKHQYDKSERVADDFAYWDKYEKYHGHNDSAVNTGLQMFNDICMGASTYEMIERYGKEYIYHAKHFKEVVRDYNLDEYRKLHKGDPLEIYEFFPMLLASSDFTDKEINLFISMCQYIRAECMMEYNSMINFYLDEIPQRRI